MPDASAPIPSYQLPGVVRPAPLINAPEPEGQGGAAPPPGPGADLRWSYADAMTAGHTLGPEDFTEAYNRAGPRQPVAPQHFPSQQETIDAALSALNQNSLPVTPEAVEQAHSNLLHHWAETGTPPSAAVQDAQTRDLVTRAPSPPAHFQELQQTIQHLETGGLNDPDSAVSPAGAVGRNQIEPGTAREYGFDPDRLREPDYNNTVRDAILGDLIKRYHGDTQAVLVAYNGGPGVADKWLAAGRDNSVLPDETRKYLTKGSKNLGLTVAQGEGPPTWGAPEEEPGQRVAAAGGAEVAEAGAHWVEDALDEVAKATGLGTTSGLFGLGDLLQKAGIPTLTEQLARTQAGMEKLRAEGAPKSEILAYGAENNPFAQAFGVGTIGEVVTGGLRQVFPELGNALNDQAREAAQASIVAASGKSRHWAAATGALFEDMRKLTARGLQETQDWLDTNPGQATNFWANAPDNIKLIDHIENVSPYAGGSRLHPQSPLRPVADAIREVYQNFLNRIEASGIDTRGFIEDYFPHFWQQPGRAVRAIMGRLGSGENLRQRSIPTFVEGIQAGLKPRYLDPIEATLRYVASLSNFLAHHDVLNEGIAQGYVKYFKHPGQAPEGWAPLTGTSALRWTPGGNLRGYAVKGWATSYNRWTSPGLLGTPAANLFKNMMMASNMATALRLSASLYHATVIAAHSMASHFALAGVNLAHGEGLQFLKNVGLGLPTPFSALAHYERGQSLISAYLKGSGNALDLQLADIAERAGSRLTGRGLEYGYDQANNLWTAYRRGTLRFEETQRFKSAIHMPGETPLQSAGHALYRLPAAVGHLLYRLTSTLTAPLFDHIIPAVKAGAWADEMETWLRHNLTASQEDVVLAGRRVQRTIDDRFGELVQDNLFWPRWLKQSLNMTMVSVSYEYGTLRTYGGALKDVFWGNELSPRLRYAIAYPIAMGLMSSVYQYFKTGLAGPSEDTPTRDLVVPRTGGPLDKFGKPPRALPPGDVKDLTQWYNLWNSAPDFIMLPSAIAGYVAGRFNPIFDFVHRVIISGTKWNGDPIYSPVPDPTTREPVPGLKQLGQMILDSFGVPIGVANFMKNDPAKTGISNIETLFGVRPPAQWLQDPEHTQAARRRATQWEIRREERERARGVQP